MSLGNKILELRKKKGLSQEQLGEKVNVTRQTISNWELEETALNPDQLKLLSNVLNTSIDELLDNNVNNIIVEKMSNTEKLAGLIIKILKFIGITFIVFLLIDIIALIAFASFGKARVENETYSIETTCKINEEEYIINLNTDKFFKCENCNDEMKNEIESLTNFNNIDESIESIEKYFKSKNGNCE